MAKAGKAKTKLVNGQRVDIVTGQPYGNPMQKPEPLKPITINDLNDTPSPMELVQPRASTATTGALASIGASANQFNERVKQQREEALARETSSLTSYTSAIEDQLTQSGAQSELYGQKGGVDDIQSELDSINNQLLQEQVALQRQIEGIDKNSEGMLRGQVEAEKRRVETESLRRQADLSVIQMGIQGRFDSAKAIADRAVDAIMERQKNELEALKLTYERNKERFDETDRRAFQIAVNERERILDREERELKEISDLSINALENGAPTSVVTAMRGAKTVQDAIQAGGSYVGMYDRAIKQAQLDNIKSQINERNATTTTGKPLTASQYTALGYANRMMEADVILDELGKDFSADTAIGGTTIFGVGLPNQLKSKARQRYEQAKRNFATAVLRKESGATITNEELFSVDQLYFPQAGDTEEVLIQKDQTRATAIANFMAEAGQDTTVQEATLNDPLKIGVTPTATNPLGI